MLQWMGGSRRKVTTTRKSTYNRQKQYFEQRKRKRQTTVCSDHAEEGINTTTSGKGFRSLDILSLTRLTTASRASQQDPCMESSGRQNNVALTPNFPEATSSLPSISLGRCPQENDADVQEESRRKCDPLADEKLSLAASPQRNMRNCYGKNSNELAEREMHMSCTVNGFKRKDTKVVEHPKIFENNLSVLDVLNDDGPSNSYERRPAHEDHAAFFVQGLGKIGTETPTKTPRKEDRTNHTCSTSRIKFCKSSTATSESILDDFGLEDKETFLGGHGSEFSSNSYGYARDGDISSTFSLPSDGQGFWHDGKFIAGDFMCRPIPLTKKRSWTREWEPEFRWADQIITASGNFHFSFDEKRNLLENWASPCEDIMHQPLGPLQESEDMVDIPHLFSNEPKIPPKAREYHHRKERTNSSWLKTMNLGTNETKHHEHLNDFDRTFKSATISVGDPLNVDLDQAFHLNNLNELRCSMPTRYKWRNSVEQHFEEPLAFNNISKIDNLFPNDCVTTSFDVPSLHRSSLMTSKKESALVGNSSSFEGTNFNIFEDVFHNSGKGWRDGGPMTKIAIDDEPFDKLHFPSGKSKHCVEVDHLKNSLFSSRGKDRFHSVSCYEDAPIDARLAELTTGIDVARASSNESNFLSTSCRETPIASDNKSSVEDRASSSKLVSIAVPGSDDCELEEASAETPELHDHKKPDDSAETAKSPTSTRQVSLKLEHSDGKNLQDVPGASDVVPSQCESDAKIPCADGLNTASKSGDPANHVMLQSYVLQLLCVQKVLTSSSIQEPAQDG